MAGLDLGPAPRVGKADIEAVKAAHPILEVLRDLGIAVQHGRIRCLRPENHAHGDRTPSVSIWPDRGQFKCWVCPDVKGDVIDLVRLARNCSFKEALSFLGAAPAGTPRAADAGGRNPAVGHGSAAEAFPARGAARPGSPARPPLPGRDLPAPSGPGQPDPDRAPMQPAFDSQGQPILFAQPDGPRTDTVHPSPSSGEAVPPASPLPAKPVPQPSASGSGSGEAEEAEAEALRQGMLASLLEACAPVGGAAGRYLAKRRIFKRTWDAQRLRIIDDYAGISRKLEAAFGRDDLIRMGFYNAAGHLRFYRHVLLFPYYDATGRAVYMQARAIDPDAKPKELSLAGRIPLPYNSRLLDGEPGQIFLCEGVIDTLTLLEQGFPAVGVPGAANFKPAWAALFRNKTVHVAFDPDAPGESGAAKAIDRLKAAGIEARRLAPPSGKDLNDWLRTG